MPLPDGAGTAFRSPLPEGADEGAEGEPGRIALLVAPDREPRHALVVEQGGTAIACPLSSGQLHRLTNALDGRGTRGGIRPLSVTGEPVHLGGSPERLIVEAGELRIEVPAGPRRALAKALRAAESTAA